ncbi:MAG: ribosome maturation factor RimP [candidate division Zixibacteria bacterium]|nr:ribosome maturation factor RimP [candidate division Zixibacteria bacterium]
MKAKIADLITPILRDEGFDLIELKLARYKQSSRLQVYVDSDHGVSIDDCARISRAIEPVLDAENLFPGSYTLEVSSPGMDRPLVTMRDFQRRIGSTLRVFFADETRQPAQGVLVAADERHIDMRIDDDITQFDLVDVRMGKILF